jgi:hypothetical protein
MEQRGDKRTCQFVLAGKRAKVSKLRQLQFLPNFGYEIRQKSSQPLNHAFPHHATAPSGLAHARDNSPKMAASSVRMRLTVEILPLEAENSHGPYQAAALAAFKGRKFALPVQLEDTFEKVWSQIDERYKRNYLTPPQAA